MSWLTFNLWSWNDWLIFETKICTQSLKSKTHMANLPTKTLCTCLYGATMVAEKSQCYLNACINETPSLIGKGVPFMHVQRKAITPNSL